MCYVGVLVAVPLVVIVARVAGDGWTQLVAALTSPAAITAYRLTFDISATAVILNTVFGVGFGILLTRYRFPGRRLLSTAADIPLSVSPIIAGLALVLVYGPVNGWFGAGLAGAGVQVIYAMPGMILATTFVSFPLVLREVVPVLQEPGYRDGGEAARYSARARGNGSSRITLPTIRPGPDLRRGLALARALGEFGAVRVSGGHQRGGTDPDLHAAGRGQAPAVGAAAPTSSLC